MKKTIRFILAVVVAPFVLILLFLDWAFEGEVGFAEDWKKSLLFKEIRSPFQNDAEEDLEKLAVKEAEENL